MPAATVAKPTTKPKRTSQKVSAQYQFAKSKLIQNLGSNPEQYKFEGGLRNAWGRD